MNLFDLWHETEEQITDPIDVLDKLSRSMSQKSDMRCEFCELPDEVSDLEGSGKLQKNLVTFSDRQSEKLN